MTHSDLPVVDSYHRLVDTLIAYHPEASDELRPPDNYDFSYISCEGFEDVELLWRLTSGQIPSSLGIFGGLQLLGPVESERHLKQWKSIVTNTDSEYDLVNPSWDESISLNPDAVRAVYYSMGWIPVFCEPLEANYLAVDLDPLPGGRVGQIILCGRDEYEKKVVCSSLSRVFEALEHDCKSNQWEIRTELNCKGCFRYMTREGGRLLSACRSGSFPAI